MFVVLDAPAPFEDENLFSSTSAYGPFASEEEAMAFADRLIEQNGTDEYTSVVSVCSPERAINEDDEDSR